MTERFTPTEVDRLQGREAYVKYLGGLSIVHNPDGEIAANLLGDFIGAEVGEGEDIMLSHAESLMWQGLRDMIIVSNPPELRHPISLAEHNYDEAIINLHGIVENVCAEQPDRLDLLDTAIRVIRPMPANDPKLYSQICHSRMNKIYTSRLLGGFMPSMRFRYILHDRRLSEFGD